MSERIIAVYKSVLKYFGMEADEEGFISIVYEGTKVNCMVEGKRLVLPTRFHQTHPSSEKMLFHPLTESVIRGESEIITRLRAVMNVKLNFTIAAIMKNLFKLGASPTLQMQLSPSQNEFLLACKDIVGSKTDYSKLVDNIATSALKQDQSMPIFVRIFLKRGGSIHGTKYARVGIVSFPFYDDMVKNVDNVYGVKMTPKDCAVFRSMLECILPGIDKPETYNRGTDSDIAPFLDALLKTSMGLVAKLNDVLEEFREHIQETDALLFNSEWVDDFVNLESLRRDIWSIPPQQGNEGKASVHDQTPPAPTPALPVPQPIPATAPQAQPAQGTWIVADASGRPLQQPMLVPPQQIAQPVPNPLPAPGGKMDLRTLVQTIAPTAQPMMPYSMPQGFQQGIPEPSWARPQMQQPMYPNPMYPQPMMMQPQPQYMQQPMLQQPMMQPQGYPQTQPQFLGYDPAGQPVYR